MLRQRFASLAAPLSLAPHVKLRREAFGGLVFRPDSGVTLELDAEAFAALSALAAGPGCGAGELAERLSPGSGATGALGGLVHLLQRLADLGVVVPYRGHCAETAAVASGAALSCSSEPALAARDETSPGPRLSAPETVHWAVTYRCAATCPDCYVRRHPNRPKTELSPAEASRLVERIAQWGVFQLAVGGGEPLLREDLPLIVHRARALGLAVHVTTGDMTLARLRLPELAPALTSLQLGLRHGELLAEPDKQVAALRECLAASAEAKVSVGANLMLANSSLAHLDRLLALVMGAGVKRLTLLRYKPPAGRARWHAENPPPQLMRCLPERLARFAKRHPEVDLRLDCALSFLQRDLAPDVAAAAGLRGCVAADRIVSLGQDGSVFPCSQLVGRPFRAGNLLVDEPAELWWHSPVLARYRGFRERLQGRCAGCPAVAHCGGCRVYAADGIGADQSCPHIEAGGDTRMPYPQWIARTSHSSLE